MICKTKFAGVFREEDRLYTINSAPGKKVYGERLVVENSIEYREWMPKRSKLAAYILNGGSSFPFKKNTSVLYLGAASGTTSSHIADIISPGSVSCVEFSPRSFRDLVTVCEVRTNMVPILADATRPEEYAFAVSSPDVLYQDIAQKDQAGIFLKNYKAFSPKSGLLVIKSRSEDVSRDPKKVYAESCSALKNAGLKVIECITLDPLEKDHAMIVVESP